MFNHLRSTQFGPCQSAHHSDPWDQDEAHRSPRLLNLGSPGDRSVVLLTRAGWTNDTQKALDPSLLNVARVGSLVVATYDGELIAIARLGNDGDIDTWVAEWFNAVADKFLGRVAL